MTEVVVTQADRDAAAALIDARPMVENPDIIRHGGADDGGFVQAFARHRIEATTAYQGRVERLEEALKADLVWLDALSQDTIEREAAVARMKAVRAILSTAVDGKDPQDV